MRKKSSFKDAFTLIEVMVAVMIISVVIMALTQMYANNTHIFLSLKKQTKVNQYASLLIANEKYGWESDETNVYELIEGFNVEDDLRRELKDIKVKLSYQELKTLDMSEEDVYEEGAESSGVVFEIGKSLIQTEDSSTAMMRFRIQP